MNVSTATNALRFARLLVAVVAAVIAVLAISLLAHLSTARRRTRQKQRERTQAHSENVEDTVDLDADQYSVQSGTTQTGSATVESIQQHTVSTSVDAGLSDAELRSLREQRNGGSVISDDR